MKRWITYLNTPQRAFAFLLLVLFPVHTVFIYSERYINGYKWEYGTLAYYGIEVLGWLCIFSILPLLIRRVAQTNVTVSKDRIVVCSILIFLVYSFISSLWAIDSTLAQQQTTHIILMCLLALLLPSVLTRTEMVGALTLGAILPLSIGLYHFFSQDLFSSVWLGMSSSEVSDGGVSVIQFGDERWLRAYGTFTHPNVFGGYIAIIAMAIFVRLQENIREHVLSWYIAMLVLVGAMLIFTMSRSAWLATTIGVGVYMVYSLKHLPVTLQRQVQKGLLAFGLGVFVAIIIAWPLVSSRIFGGSVHEYASVNERLALQDIALEIFWQHPIVGVGAGNMTAALMVYDGTKAGYAYQPVHSVPLLILVEYGIIGVILLGVVGYTILVCVVRHSQCKTGLLLCIVLVPPALLDHYLWTSVHGLGIVAIYLAILLSSTVESRDIADQAHIDGVVV